MKDKSFLYMGREKEKRETQEDRREIVRNGGKKRQKRRKRGRTMRNHDKLEDFPTSVFLERMDVLALPYYHSYHLRPCVLPLGYFEFTHPHT